MHTSVCILASKLTTSLVRAFYKTIAKSFDHIRWNDCLLWMFWTNIVSEKSPVTMETEDVYVDGFGSKPRFVVRTFQSTSFLFTFSSVSHLKDVSNLNLCSLSSPLYIHSNSHLFLKQKWTSSSIKISCLYKLIHIRYYSSFVRVLPQTAVHTAEIMDWVWIYVNDSSVH